MPAEALLTSNPQSEPLGPFRGTCCVMPGEIFKGSLFFGGAGLDGGYIPKMVSALRNAGIYSAMYVDREIWSAGIGFDASIGVLGGRDFDPRFPMLLRIPKNGGSQFNLIGYSYGSIIAAQVAMKYANGGTQVDHLVLIGSPISANFLTLLRYHKKIGRVIVINLTDQGDPIIAGMSELGVYASTPVLLFQMLDSEGHFYLAKDNEEGDRRRKKLAEFLYGLGLR